MVAPARDSAPEHRSARGHDPARGASAWPRTLLLVATGALCLAPLAGHLDDVDAQTYLVVARNLARSKGFFDLSFLPALWPRFREHLPFGFWPAVAAIRLAGERAVPLVYAALSLAAAWVTSRSALRLAGETAGLVALLVLGTCESFWHYSARLLLEPPLFLLTALSVDAWLAGRPGRAGAWASLAVLVKGPFGLLPLGALALAEYLLQPTRPRLARGALVAALAVLPLAVFLLADQSMGNGTWYAGYLERQLLASASGARQDGVTSAWFALRVVLGRFWPGLPLVFAGVILALRKAAPARTIALACALALAALSFPVRKWGNHVYVVFPLLALLSGIAAAHWLRLRPRHAFACAASLAFAASLFALCGGGRLVLQPPCEVSTALAAGLAQAGPRIAVVGADPLLIAELAAETGLEPIPSNTPLPGLPALAPRESATPAGFIETAHGQRWKLLLPR